MIIYLYKMIGKREYITMETNFREEIRSRYTKPYRRNITMLIAGALTIFIMIASAYFASKAKDPNTGYAPFVITAIGFTVVGLMAYPKFKKMNIHYRHDAEFGMIVKEQTAVIKVFDTPAGINIYWLDSDSIKTFTPDPYRIFREGDVVNIYYLEHAGEYLSYEI